MNDSGPTRVSGAARFTGPLNTQSGDLADFIVTAGEVDAVAETRGRTTLRSYFEELARDH